MVVVVEVAVPGGEPVQQLWRELSELPGNVAKALTPQRKGSAVIGGELDDRGKGLIPAEIIVAGVSPWVLGHGWSFFHCGHCSERRAEHYSGEDRAGRRRRYPANRLDSRGGVMPYRNREAARTRGSCAGTSRALSLPHAGGGAMLVISSAGLMSQGP